MLTSVPIIDHVWDSVGWWLKAALAIATAGILLAKSVKYVPQGELGLRHFRGKVRPGARPIRPGWALHVPFVGGVFKKSVLPQTWRLDPVVLPKRGSTWEATYAVTFQIDQTMLYQAWFGHQDPDEYLRTTCVSWLWQVLNACDASPDRVDHAEVAHRVIDPASHDLLRIGVRILEVRHLWTAQTTASQLGEAIRHSHGEPAELASVALVNGHLAS